MSTLRRIGEFGLIERLARILPAAPTVVEGVGDDCAVVRAGGRLLLLSCDLSIENVHFRRSTADARDIGWKAAATSLSDIAAMGGTPLFALVALACPADTDVGFIEEIYQGMIDAVSEAGAVIVGGDTTRSAEGIVIDVTAVGEPIGDRYLLRRGARAGDYLAVTGSLGNSAAGLHSLEHGHDAPGLIAAHRRPTPRIGEGQWLAACPDVHAMIDVSDGLLQDAGHLAEAAELGVDVYSEALILDERLMRYCGEHGIEPQAFALAGGEDYELAFAIDGLQCRTVHDLFRREFQTPMNCVGRFTDAWRGVRIDGQPPSTLGFDHFR